MSRNQQRFSLLGVFFAFGDAIAVSAAVEGGRQPHARNLRGLGIDPEQFRRIGR